ncbi:hypothetical protein FRB94_014298 [Tulasnella sp. JGI-2019a]|nr:hypothetical protein FRB94_014298 [Tulasnella sp. JGI-2019a]
MNCRHIATHLFPNRSYRYFLHPRRTATPLLHRCATTYTRRDPAYRPIRARNVRQSRSLQRESVHRLEESRDHASTARPAPILRRGRRTRVFAPHCPPSSRVAIQTRKERQIPQRTQPRTLVLCFDGTANHFEHDRNTNVVHLFAMLKRSDPERQLVYYQTGLGTYTPPGIGFGFGQLVVQTLDQGLAWYLEEHVLGGYRFLMQTYRAGDKICLFGFSRGAYTARALAGMLYRVGLLPMHNIEQVPFAYKIFKDSKKEGEILKKDPEDPRGYLSSNFRTTFSREVTIEFVGLWDTVASVGLVPRSLPNTATNPSVLHVRHAVSLDENRANFKSNLWSAPKCDPDTITTIGRDPKRIADPKKASVEEVWFAGGHGDVGGGWVPYRRPHALSRIPLRWIVREATERSSIIWEENVLKKFRVRKPKTEAELAEYAEHEKADALSEHHSPFAWHNLWWVLEIIPLVVWRKYWDRFFRILWPNLFRARNIRRPTEYSPTKVHSSVKTRLEHYICPKQGLYKSKARWNPRLTKFVDEWALPKGEDQKSL